MIKKEKIINILKRNFNKSKIRKVKKKILKKIKDKKDIFKKAIFDKKIIIIEKKIGQTPLEVLDNFRATKSSLKNIKMAYAGRLDPLASGELLVLLGDECKKKQKYLNLDKEYIFEILLDFSSDSKDVLGISDFSSTSHRKTIINISKAKDDKGKFIALNSKKIKKKFLGKMELEYPVYSSKTVKGKPLFLWALEKRLNEIKIPTKKVEIYNIDLIDLIVKNSVDIKKEIFKNINSIKKVTEESKEIGKDFRRKEILKKWNDNFTNIGNGDEEFLILKVKTTVSSGTYMRTLAEKISKEIFSAKGLAFSIHRTKIGKIYKVGKIKFFKKIK